jgi:hypothetical protein
MWLIGDLNKNLSEKYLPSNDQVLKKISPLARKIYRSLIHTRKQQKKFYKYGKILD